MSKHYIALNRHALRAKIAGLAHEGRALRAPLRRLSSTDPKGVSAVQGGSRRRPMKGPDRVWLQGEAHHVGTSARLHLLAYAYLYRKGFAVAENPETTRMPIDEAKLTPIVLHHLHLDKPTYPYEIPSHVAATEEYSRRKLTYENELGQFKVDLAAAIGMTNKRILLVQKAWMKQEGVRADRRAAKVQMPRSLRPTG